MANPSLSTVHRAFRKCNCFTSRPEHFKHRPVISNETQSQWGAWLSSLLKTFPSNYVRNCDETIWQPHLHNILTRVKTGIQHGSRYIAGDEKDVIIILATVSASGMKGLLHFLAESTQPGSRQTNSNTGVTVGRKTTV
jgi:hypothetical protein